MQWKKLILNDWSRCAQFASVAWRPQKEMQYQELEIKLKPLKDVRLHWHAGIFLLLYIMTDVLYGQKRHQGLLYYDSQLVSSLLNKAEIMWE